VQKTRPKDSDTLYSVDYELQKQCLHDISKWSCITCKEAQRFADGGQRRRELIAIENGDKAMNGIADYAERLKIKEGFRGREASMGKTGKPCKIFEQMAARASSKKSDTQSEQPSQSKSKEPVKTKEDTKHQAAKSFFGKTSARTKTETRASQPPDTPSQTQTTKKKAKGDDDIKLMDQPKSPSVIPGSPEADLKQTIHPKKSKRKTKKGRRRLRTQELASDSDSDRETPEPKRVSTVMESPKDNGSPIGKPESPPLKHLDKPKRKRMKKLVSKTYINEDGEFVTEKAYESYSTDASDVEVTRAETAPVQEKAVSSDSVIPRQSPEKRSAKGKQNSNKQSNLMSFFHRPK
jgi:DNA polymerase delta subunit 3